MRREPCDAAFISCYPGRGELPIMHLPQSSTLRNLPRVPRSSHSKLSRFPPGTRGGEFLCSSPTFFFFFFNLGGLEVHSPGKATPQISCGLLRVYQLSVHHGKIVELINSIKALLLPMVTEALVHDWSGGHGNSIKRWEHTVEQSCLPHDGREAKGGARVSKPSSKAHP